VNFLKKIPPAVLIGVPGIIVIALIFTQKPTPSLDFKEDTETPLVQVAVKTAQPETASLSVTTQGTVTPKREIDLVAQVSGQVQSVEQSFVNGGFFKTGQLLIQIEDRDYRATYLSAKARKAEAEQRLAEERGQARRAKSEWRDLGNREANQLFLRKPQLAAAEASLDSAIAELAGAELNLERTQIRVPFDGRVRTTHVNLGQYVSPGTRIATVYDTSVAEIRLPLSDRQAALVELPLGYAAASEDEAPSVTIKGIIAGQARQWQGYIRRTDASVDLNSRMYFAVAEVDNPFSLSTPASGSTAQDNTNTNDYPLVVGLFVEAEIEGKVLNNVIGLPRESVFKRDKIYILDEDNQVEQKQVNVLHKTKSKVWISADMPSETMIVIEKHGLLAPGTKVEPIGDIPPAAITVSEQATPAPTDTVAEE